jgi:hypothetical protein
MENVAAGFSLRQHRLESLCHQRKEAFKMQNSRPRLFFF